MGVTYTSPLFIFFLTTPPPPHFVLKLFSSHDPPVSTRPTHRPPTPKVVPTRLLFVHVSALISALSSSIHVRERVYAYIHTHTYIHHYYIIIFIIIIFIFVCCCCFCLLGFFVGFFFGGGFVGFGVFFVFVLLWLLFLFNDYIGVGIFFIEDKNSCSLTGSDLRPPAHELGVTSHTHTTVVTAH